MRRVNLTKKQIERLSEYLANFSLVIAASVIAPLFSGTKFGLLNLLYGLLLMMFFLVASLFIS